MAALPVISAGVDRATHDRVLWHLLAMTVAKDQHCRCKFSVSLGLSDLGIGFGIVGRCVRAAIRGRLSPPEAHIPISLQLNH